MATLPLLIHDHSPSADSTLTVRRKWVAKREPSARNAAPAMAHIDVMWRIRLRPCAHTPFDGNAFDNAHRRAEIGRRGRGDTGRHHPKCAQLCRHALCKQDRQICAARKASLILIGRHWLSLPFTRLQVSLGLSGSHSASLSLTRPH